MGVTERETRDVLASLDRYGGCMFGLAIGDAMGAPVEFETLGQIRAARGPLGVTDLEPWRDHPAGSFTDDTQMAMATGVGTLRAMARFQDRGICSPLMWVYASYLNWLATQSDPDQRRAPGHSCIAMLQSGQQGALADRAVVDDPSVEVLGRPSKGAGGIMRAAPAGLAYTNDGAFTWGCEIAVVTHTHPCGYLPAGFLAGMVDMLVRGSDLRESVRATRAELTTWPHHEETLSAVDAGLRAVDSDDTDADAIEKLGGAWVGEEALAVTLLCALRHPDDWSAGVLAAVNHSGDSDTTGSTVGALLGAKLGLRAIPSQWVEQVERSDELLRLTDDLHAAVVLDEPVSWERYPGG